MRRWLVSLFVLLPALASAQVQPSGIGAGVNPPIFGQPASAVSGSGGFSPQLYGPQSCTVPAYSFTGATTSGYGFNSSTACVVIGGSQVLGVTSSGATLSNLTATRVLFAGASGLLTDDSGLTYNSTTDSLTVGGGLTVTNNIDIGAARVIQWTSSTRVLAPANALLNVTDGNANFGVQINSGTAAPTVSSCGTGAITANSRNTAGGFTATGATACTVTFGSPAWTNTPFCTVTLRTAPTTTPYISAKSTTAFTVSGLTAGDVIDYICIGPL